MPQLRESYLPSRLRTFRGHVQALGVLHEQLKPGRHQSKSHLVMMRRNWFGACTPLADSSTQQEGPVLTSEPSLAPKLGPTIGMMCWMLLETLRAMAPGTHTRGCDTSKFTSKMATSYESFSRE
jgi:hypothetical protein